ncbi:histidine kinase [Saccharophagus degradans 2-40]|uniref:Histidine kinase n=2 Tax=Saccharophagus degradans TaxID=86304 RepID=Q21E54_SACD2|nr:histidine kinase [Saccharophagus degradans 2-40]
MMVVVDTEKAAPITGVASVSATFENVSEFANRELPKEFSKSFTDLTMNAEYQKKYNELFSAALQEGAFKNKWKPSENEFSAYLERSGVDSDSIDVLTNRLGMHKTIGNNQYYEGNGLTKNKSEQSDKKYGVVETLNFERKKLIFKS